MLQNVKGLTTSKSSGTAGNSFTRRCCGTMNGRCFQVLRENFSASFQIFVETMKNLFLGKVDPKMEELVQKGQGTMAMFRLVIGSFEMVLEHGDGIKGNYSKEIIEILSRHTKNCQESLGKIKLSARDERKKVIEDLHKVFDHVNLFYDFLENIEAIFAGNKTAQYSFNEYMNTLGKNIAKQNKLYSHLSVDGDV